MNYDHNEIEKVKDLLLNRGFATDEHVKLGSAAFEFPAKLKADLRKAGVAGAICNGAYTRRSGTTFYWIALGSREKAKRLAEAWAITHPYQ